MTDQARRWQEQARAAMETTPPDTRAVDWFEVFMDEVGRRDSAGRETARRGGRRAYEELTGWGDIGVSF